MPAAAPDAGCVPRLIADLGSSSLETRQAATQVLTRVRHANEAALRQALATATDAEAKRRLTRVVIAMDRLTAEEVVQVRLVEVLERIGSKEAVGLLTEFAAGHSVLAREASAAVRRLRR